MAPKIIALDTSTDACSVALWYQNKSYHKFVVQPRKHSELLLPMLDELLSEQNLTLQDIKAIAFSAGPGSFTGVRMTCSITQGLAFALDIPVIPVSTLAVIAQETYLQQQAPKVISYLASTKDKLYWAEYHLDESGIMRLKGKEHLSESLPETTHIKSNLHPHARSVLTLGLKYLEEGVSLNAEKALPVYL